MKKVLLLFILLSSTAVSHAQFSRYIVRFKNKGSNPFTLSTPGAYLSPRAIDRRTRYSIPYDSTDLPVTPSYVAQVAAVANVTVLNVSKWINGVSILTTDPAAITTINSFPFVLSVNSIALRESSTSDKFQSFSVPLTTPVQRQVAADYYNYGANAYNEIHLHWGEFLHNIGLRGQNMQIAMLDAGYFNYNTLDAMDSIIANNQVLSTWDFVARHASVAEDHSHGMQCLSTIAANLPGQFVGKAPKANFHLFRTEDVATEYPIEEFNWVCGAERADSTGADVISSSLGYFDFDGTAFDYTYSQMNGNTTISAQGADLAAKKGLLVFNAIGNEGSNPWHFLTTPSDGDSVVAVGGVSSTGAMYTGSSWGPSSDGQVKPDVLSIGLSAVVQFPNNTIALNTGTSFACPNMAGLATCLWQGFPEFNNMRIVRALHQASSLYTSPHPQMGYGIPNMKTAFSSLLTEFATSSATINQCSVTLNWTSKDVQAMKYEIERKTLTDINYSKIGEVVPQPGLILANHNYQFVNNLVNVPNGLVSYRVRQVIDTSVLNFTAVYIDTATVTASGCLSTGVTNPQPGKDFVTIFPNPAGNSNASLFIETIYGINNLHIIIFDMTGRKLWQDRKSKTSGQAIFELPSSQLPKGKYIIKVLDNLRAIGTAELIRQ